MLQDECDGNRQPGVVPGGRGRFFAGRFFPPPEKTR